MTEESIVEGGNDMLDHLFSPFSINGKTLKNRMVVPPMVMNYCTEDGFCTERFIAYHEAKAKGGFGMIITEDFAVTPRGKGFKYLPGLWKDEQIEGFKEFTKRIHQHNAVVIAQIYHCGRQTSKAVIGEAPEAPSAIPCPFSPDMPEELTVERIREIVECYGDCARRAKEAGFDGIEIHGAHGYLIAQFMSPYSNKRTDEYGGPLQNRIRFAIEIIKNIREKCGDDFIVGYRISGDEHVTGGRNIEDTKTIVPYLEEAGISYIHVTAGVYRSFDAVIPAMYCDHAWIADYAKEVKQVVKNIPVISVGRYNDPRIAENVIACGKADLVSFGRQSLADPDTPVKAKEGRFDEIRQCIGCHHACIGNLLANVPGGCILNPTLGKEYEIKPVKAEVSKNVLVIGAGPAGLAAAISAAEAGHNVKVYEKNRWAGGQFRLGAVPAGKGEITTFITWQMNELKKLGVSVTFNTVVTKELVDAEKPDVIIAATGAEPIVPRIPGVDHACVVTAHDVLAGKVNTGASIVVIGGGCVGAEVANHLASNLKVVTLVEMLGDIATDEVVVPKWGLMADIEKNKVRVCTNTTVTEIKEKSVVLSGKVNEEIEADTVVLSVGSKSVTGLAEELKEAGYDVRVIGDAAKVGLAGQAISQGFELGRGL